MNPTGYSPDYFNACYPDSLSTNGHDVPVNYFGNQTARTGVAYVGLILEFFFGANNLREYVQVQLTDSLEPGQKYVVSFYVSISDSTSIAVNDIGAYFSDTAITSAQMTYLPVTPQINNDALLNPLTQRNVWIQVVDSLIAQGGEKFITIGNFKDDTNTDSTFVSGGSSTLQYAYYYIEDVSVIKSSSVGINETFKNGFALFPNPFTNTINLTVKTNELSEITLYDITSRKLLQQKFTSSISLNTDQLAKGIYLYEVRNKNGIIKNGKVVKE
ncbi:MAG: T9SS type A sorting domain-containing protein [Bacteroidota bacterium]